QSYCSRKSSRKCLKVGYFTRVSCMCVFAPYNFDGQSKPSDVDKLQIKSKNNGPNDQPNKDKRNGVSAYIDGVKNQALNEFCGWRNPGINLFIHRWRLMNFLCVR